MRADGVGHAQHERRLRPDHDEVDTQPAGQGAHRGPVERVDRVVRGDLRGARVARGDVHLRDAGVAREGEGERVLTSPGTEDEDAQRVGHVAEILPSGSRPAVAAN